MTFKIYRYDNIAVEVNCPDKEIERIHVLVLSGDEVVTVYFKDGTAQKFDSYPNGRITEFFDGSYDVTGEGIQKWIEFDATSNRTISYARQDAMEEEENE